MPSMPLIQAHGAAIPAIGLGTFQMTGDTCVSAVQSAVAAGYRHVDTAAMYGNETEVGLGLKASGVPRDEVFVTTKVWRDDIAEGDLERSIEGSLKQLGLSAVDLLLIHWPNEAVPLERSTAALCEAKRRGLARHIGVSNYPAALLQRAIGLASEPIVCDQVEYHPYLDQSRLLAACRSHGVAMTAYCPIGKSKILSDPTLVRIAERHGKLPSQVVLRWHVQQPGVVAIPKSATPANIASNLDILDFALDESEMRDISALHRPGGRMVDPGFAPAWDRAASERLRPA